MATSHIISFVQSLNIEEIKIVREFIYKSNETEKQSKLSKLFETLVENPQKKYAEGELSKIIVCNALMVCLLIFYIPD